MGPRSKRFPICNLFKQFVLISDQPLLFYITQARSCHHGTSGVSARVLMVFKSKRASVFVVMAIVVGRTAKQRNVQVRKEENTIHITFCLFF